VAGPGDHVLSLPASIEGMTKAVLSLRRARTDPPFGPEDHEGIAADDMARIFRQFEQLDGSSSRRVGGVGLGLHLCMAAAAALGGKIWAESDPGAGSRFSVWLPSKPSGSTEATPR
jgi:light-regulated signal transduction histidine kinase (bacteriophytochrome)